MRATVIYQIAEMGSAQSIDEEDAGVVDAVYFNFGGASTHPLSKGESNQWRTHS
jgi:hypothetical protein